MCESRSRLSCSAPDSSAKIGSASACKKDSGVLSCDLPVPADSEPREIRRIGVDACRGVDIVLFRRRHRDASLGAVLSQQGPHAHGGSRIALCPPHLVFVVGGAGLIRG